MKKNIGICALCKSKEKICNSHIIPEFFYKTIYDKKHRTFQIPVTKNDVIRIIQKGFNEPLLCESCESKFCKWEQKIKYFFRDLEFEKSTNFQIFDIQPKGFFISGYDYLTIKLGLLSIFWRMSLSNQNIFKDYSFGVYNERLRQILNKNKNFDLPTLSFPITIRKGLVEGKFERGIIITYPKGRNYLFELSSLYGVILDGFIIDLFLTEDKFKMDFELMLFRENNSSVILRKSIVDYKNTGFRIDKMNWTEADRLFKKLNYKTR